MINTMEGFLKAYEGNFPSELPDSDAGDSFYFDLQDAMHVQFDGKLTSLLNGLGILYTFGGALVINPMAIRVLKRMRAEGKELSGEAFRREIETSRDLYHVDHLGEEPELAY